jgi:hypothetical protein
MMLEALPRFVWEEDTQPAAAGQQLLGQSHGCQNTSCLPVEQEHGQEQSDGGKVPRTHCEIKSLLCRD